MPSDDIEVDTSITKQHCRINIPQQLFLDLSLVDQTVPDSF